MLHVEETEVITFNIGNKKLGISTDERFIKQ